MFIAISMMSIVACSDDEGDEPTPTPKPPTNDTMPNDTLPNDTLPPAGTEYFDAVANGETVTFTTYSATLDTNSFPFRVQINGSKSSPNESISISLVENFEGTATYPQSTSQRITYTRGGTTFTPLSGELIISKNDSVVSGTFEFEGRPIAGSDTLTINNGKFYIKKQ